MRLSGVALGIALCCLGICSSAESFSTIKTFGIITNVTGTTPNSLERGPDGVLYGATADGEGIVRGTVYRVQPDGTGFTVLKWFTNPLEGANPSGIIVSGTTIYGTTSKGGSAGLGTVFKMNIDGTAFIVLKEFTGLAGDGVGPLRGLILSGDTLYGIANTGSFGGTIFSLKTDGRDYIILKTWEGSEGGAPGALLLADGVLYGATFPSFAEGGTIFRMNVDGTSFSVLKESHAFAMAMSEGVLYGVNSTSVFKLNIDGTDFSTLQPFAGNVETTDLKLSNGVLYGSTLYGGDGFSGSVFRLGVDGSDFRLLKHFYETESFWPIRLLVLESVIYGLTQLTGPPPSDGTLFRLSTDGTGYTTFRLFAPDPDGAAPSGLVISGGELFGTTKRGGGSRGGTVYKINSNSSGYTVLHQFDVPPGGISTNINGMSPDQVLVEGTAVFGITEYGGLHGTGTIFKMNRDGSGFTVLRTFNAADYFGTRTNIGGAFPHRLYFADGELCGTTTVGGATGFGTIFRLKKDGSEFRVIKELSAEVSNVDLTLSGTTFYGTGGQIFRMNLDGSELITIKQFSPTQIDQVSGWSTNSDGSAPSGELTIAGKVVYGTTVGGGHFGLGTVFSMNTDGTGFVTLRHLNDPDGVRPSWGVKLYGGVLYGVTSQAGTSRNGNVFKLNTDGSGFRIVKGFTPEDGWGPGTFLIHDHALYGILAEGGMMNRGVLFKIDLLDAITIQRQSDSVVLSWPDPSISLQAAPTCITTWLSN